MTRPYVFGAWSVAALLISAVGCGSDGGLELAPVTGTVSYQDKALDHGQVVFTPTGETPGPPAVGAIKSDGTFTMVTAGTEGASIGSHEVTVHCRRVPTPAEIKNLKITESLIGDKYWKSGESGLMFEVKDEDNHYEIDLQ